MKMYSLLLYVLTISAVPLKGFPLNTKTLFMACPTTFTGGVWPPVLVTNG